MQTSIHLPVAGNDNLKLNPSKLCEMIIHQSSTKILNYPPVHPDLKRVEQIAALGVTFNNTYLSCGPHVNLIIAKAAASPCALKPSGAMDWMARPYGTSLKIVLWSSCYYASPFWRGFIKCWRNQWTSANKYTSQLLVSWFQVTEWIIIRFCRSCFVPRNHSQPSPCTPSTTPRRKSTAYNYVSSSLMRNSDVYFVSLRLHCVPKKHVTTFSIITLTISVRLQ